MRPTTFWQGFEKQAGADKRVAKVAVLWNGKLMMGKRRDNGKWTEPGGHLDRGELPLAGAVRELYEETGIKVDPKRLNPLLDKEVTLPDGRKLKVYTYVLHMPEMPRTTVEHDPDKEVHDWQFIDIREGLPTEIASNMHVPLERNVIAKGLKLERSNDQPLKAKLG